MLPAVSQADRTVRRPSSQLLPHQRRVASEERAHCQLSTKLRELQAGDWRLLLKGERQHLQGQEKAVLRVIRPADLTTTHFPHHPCSLPARVSALMGYWLCGCGCECPKV